MADDSRPLLVKRLGDRLFPVAPMDADALVKFPSGKPLKCKLTQNRSAPRLRLYWSMIGLIHENLDREISEEDLHNAIKVRLGFFTVVPFKSGVEKVPKSIAFDKMEEAEFARFLDAFKRLVREQIIPGIGTRAFENAALEMMGEEA